MKANNEGVNALQTSPEGVKGEEEALNLDIYRPNNNRENLPVLLYLHGGNNQTGNAQEISGESFVSEHDAIIVTINYRLGILGFNPLPALKTGNPNEDSGNYTLLDINKSLEWITENIESFGGDKNNITVSGFSAGGRNVMAMLVSPLFKGKFQRAISFSGGMTLSDETKSQEVFAKSLASEVVKDNIKDNETEAEKWLLQNTNDVREYLYGLSDEQVTSFMGNAGIRMEVFPHLYKDGVVIPKEGFDSKVFNDVPLLMLTGEQEFSLFALSDSYFKEMYTNEELVKGSYAYKKYTFVNEYGGKLYGLFNTTESSEKLIKNYESPIYNMEISFGSDSKYIDKSMELVGSFHGVFMPLLDSNNKNYMKYIGTSYQSKGAIELQNNFQDYIFEFMRKGNPNNSNLPKWDDWKKERKSLYLDATDDKSIISMQEKKYDYNKVLEDIKKDKNIEDKDKEILIKNVLRGRWFSELLDKEYGDLSNFYQ